MNRFAFGVHRTHFLNSIGNFNAPARWRPNRSSPFTAQWLWCLTLQRLQNLMWHRNRIYAWGCCLCHVPYDINSARCSPPLCVERTQWQNPLHLFESNFIAAHFVLGPVASQALNQLKIMRCAAKQRCNLHSNLKWSKIPTAPMQSSHLTSEQWKIHWIDKTVHICQIVCPAQCSVLISFTCEMWNHNRKIHRKSCGYCRKSHYRETCNEILWSINSFAAIAMNETQSELFPNSNCTVCSAKRFRFTFHVESNLIRHSVGNVCCILWAFELFWLTTTTSNRSQFNQTRRFTPRNHILFVEAGKKC